MKLFEFQAKEIFRMYNIPLSSSSYLIKDVRNLDEIVDRLRFPCVLKAQVLAGGRGKAGGIKIARNREEVLEQAGKIFELVINGERTRAILIEDYVDIERELYTSVTIDTTTNEIVVLASP
ncbi:MAG: ATP-grasp domain-containing protein, partial [Zestosphaera sp.]